MTSAASGAASEPVALADRRLYLCTPSRPDLARFLTACIDGGVDVVQLRDKTGDDEALLEQGRLALEVCRSRAVPLVMNDRPDLAARLGADGVHVGQEDAPPREARATVGPDALVGLSTHAPAELDASEGEPVDYVSVGPVTPTPTKPGRPGTGLGYVAYAATHCTRPFFITGGVTPGTVAELVDHGARHFVVVRHLTEAPRPGEAAAALRRAIDRALG
ncbi:MAG: thiamine phosphate synthase [Acidimicrobiales bacterium]|nr:thiamine phosphate synthase [Acidimicrobiales bacterium]